MEMLPNSLPQSDEGFTKWDVTLPATILGPEQLYSSTNSVRDNSYLHDELDDDNTVISEDGSHDDLTTNDVLGVVEILGSVKRLKRSFLRDPLKDLYERNYQCEPNRNIEFDPFPESSRDRRHVGDLRWHDYYQMSELEETALPPMRYTLCNLSTVQRCFHRATSVFQVFDMKIQTSLLDVNTPVEVYGIIAVRDGEDNRRNYLFNRSRDNPLAINPTRDLLRLMNPKRAMSLLFNCLIEADIRVKMTGNSSNDITVIDGCMDFMEEHVLFSTLYKCSSNGPYGVATLDMIMFEYGVEATIQLEFSRVPLGGFELKMYGYTSLHKNVYTFIDSTRECYSFVSSDGKHPEHFVAAVHIDDTLNIDFLEGDDLILFKAAIHGNEKKLYHFRNGAIVSVMLSWSTTNY